MSTEPSSGTAPQPSAPAQAHDPPARSEPAERTEPAAPAKAPERTEDLAAKDEANSPGNIDGLIEKLTDSGEKRFRTLWTAAVSAASRSLGADTDPLQIFNYYGANDSASSHRTGVLEPVASLALTRVRDRFAAPDGYRDLWRRIEQRGVVILRAPAGYGKTWTTIHLLDAVCGGSVRPVNAPFEPVRFSDTAISDDTGYFWHVRHHTHASAVEAHHVEQLAARLMARHARAVVIASSDVTGWQPGLQDYLVDLPAPPNAAEVLANHLREQFKTEDDELRVLSDPDVVETLNTLSADSSVADLVDFASHLTNATLARQSLRTVCAAFQRSHAGLAWFKELREHEDRSFAVSLAVLNELPYPAVTGATSQFERLVRTAERPDKPPLMRVYTRTTSDLLASARAELLPGRETTEYGEVPVETVRSTIWGYPKRLLKLLWSEYPGTHQILLDWLGELVHDVDPKVGANAATAVGILSEFDFQRIHDRLLRQWAHSFERQERSAAATALRMPALNADLAPVIWRLLEEWTAPEQPLQVQVTALAALGAAVGATDCRRALTIFDSRIEHYLYRQIQAVCQAMTELFDDRDHEAAQHVLETLARWADQQEFQRIETALACFLQIAIDLKGQHPTGEEWPTLLRFVEAAPEHRQKVARVWRQAMNRPRFTEPTMEALRLWVWNAEQAPASRESLRDLVREIPQNHRDVRTLCYYLRVWATADKNPSPACANLLLTSLKTMGVFHRDAA